MPKLVLGPLLRYVGESQATVWVETDAAAEVEVLASAAAGGSGEARGRAPTFAVQGHHYALILVEGLEPKGVYEYRVALDGQQVWPQAPSGGPEFPPSTIRTLQGDHPLRIAFGSCRLAAPHEPPWTLPPSVDRRRGKGADALYALALRMRDADPGTWPDLLLLLGDQIYADDTSEQVQAFIRSRRDVGQPPGLEVADFEEYTR
ncbi:MAG TPA: alkaline phosphatase family protein, partial [Actinomycetota bacterium]